ncbi:MAG: helix-turn-helix transcriptional regulator [Cyanobacteriota bacterium]|nr:helix-turn-helix transcriptional regulator [Cyanobacteriota bacterium]
MFGERLQKVRKKLKLSQEDISTQIGISYRAYSSYEREDRKPPIDFLEKLATQYNINLNYLIAGIGKEFIAPKFDVAKDELRSEVLQILKEEGVIK